MKYQGGFQQSYNAQAAVDVESKLIVAQDCSNRANDKNELLPVLKKIHRKLGKPREALADTGYYNEKAITKCEKRRIKPISPQGEKVTIKHLRTGSTLERRDLIGRPLRDGWKTD
jgi:hypothetical protein